MLECCPSDIIESRLTMGKAKHAAHATKTANAATAMTSTSATADLALDQRGDGLYSGTFRWTEQKKFPALPPRDYSHLNPPPTAPLALGWQGYLERCHSGRNLVAMATQDPSFLDALSFPMTFIYAATLLRLAALNSHLPPDCLHVLVVGATVKAEQRILQQTNYWNELAAFFPHVPLKLWFIGPEVSADTRPSPLPPSMQVGTFRGTAGAFLAAHPFLTPRHAIVIGYNTGFGNFVESDRFDLLWSWLPDLYAIADSGIAAVFACANDYADLNGEFAVQTRVVGARMLLFPKENPFSAASHLHEEGKKNTAWSRANSFLYVIQGCDPTRRHRLRSGDMHGLNVLLHAEDDKETHMEDSLGRHYFQGMILSKEQAAKCIPSPLRATSARGNNQIEETSRQSHERNAGRATRGAGPTDLESLNSSLASATVREKEASVEDDNNQASEENECTPEYTLVSNMENTLMRITIATPLMKSARNMELDVSAKTLRFAAPGMYRIELDLPWAVAAAGDAMQAVFVKKTRTLCIELRSSVAL
ncbi:Aste57867_20630 [Aphanomyces stellatus]|uniref:Aste57867_20630 protein n=1 Tax=Aphanomyces stellatus TaxID=120398 RepID=A0A485LK42_9STRA|nr:hypothetical protein As57867_020562 [Aphanomyces stellatus]VFT97310.1 Aste57867_20630 [Aphanomyces stellatus]